ncbi:MULTISPECIES: DUF4190 domain-containing protein [Paenarthrobacter]|uniref:DUF4190 domain-containing protein n=1 Tax=Paenarthrobacter TaxID=1742992 RepID=UPI00074D2982|nr:MULTISPECIES: DUF4190 domain-containing protein [Paenarthrobacter]AMB38857.1 hypothetical protein AUT26_00370 [Arthrobacter sp. ATCC 21022]BCW82399.1 hypothetical protein NicSoilE8_00720 [Arthrobacter sp. NicSoilE8]KUR63254.1 hypothetical protein JM67_18160 [Arthrobacter sp. ATCC 21022]QSZ52102.1 hypothetical protein AYX19_03190 [Paenarthrobacter ureafaciens]RWW95052.1 DUF4190 domain-containing protein [Paenarthrobacter ureafaciens]
MSEQPNKGNEDKPAGYEPPQYVPPAEFTSPGQSGSQSGGQSGSVPPPPSYDSSSQGATQPLPPYDQSAYTRNAQGQNDFQSSYTPGDYSQQPPSPYGQQSQPPSPYQQPYGQPSPYGQPAYYAMPSQPKGLSIASMCCGIAIFVGFGFFILPQIAAVILGHLALNREPAGRGMAIAGLVMGYIGIALTIIFAIFFFAAIGASTSSYRY